MTDRRRRRDDAEILVPLALQEPRPGRACCFEADSGAEAVAIAEHLRAGEIAADAARTTVTIGKSSVPVYLVTVPPDDLPRAAAWLDAHGYGDRERLRAENVRRLNATAVRGIARVVSVVAFAILVPSLAVGLGHPAIALVVLGLQCLALIIIVWRRDSRPAETPVNRPR